MKSSVETLHTVALVFCAAMLSLFEGPAEIACVIVLVTTALTGRFRGYRPERVEIAILLWGAIGLVGLLSTEHSIGSEDKFRPLLASAFLIGAVLRTSTAPRVLRWMAIAFLVSYSLNAAVGLYQYQFGALPFDDLFIRNPESRQLTIPGTSHRAASGLFYNRLKLAHVGIAAVGLVGVIAAQRDAGRRAIRWGFAALAFALFGAAMVLTYARLSLVALSVGAILMFFVSGRVRWAAPIVVGSLLLAVAWAQSPLGEKHVQRIARDLPLRAEIIDTGVQLFLRHPVLGVGHGVYTHEAPSAAGEGVDGAHMVDAHNLFVHGFAETGLVGGCAFVFAFGLGLVLLTRRVWRGRSEVGASASLERWALFVLCAYGALGVLHYPLHHKNVALLFWIALGVSRRPWQHTQKS